MIFLSEPNVKYRESFLEGLHEFQREGRMLQYDPESVRLDFAGFMRIEGSPVRKLRYWIDLIEG